MCEIELLLSCHCGECRQRRARSLELVSRQCFQELGEESSYTAMTLGTALVTYTAGNGGLKVFVERHVDLAATSHS